MPKSVYVGYVDGVFSAWILCKTCHRRVYFSLFEEPERVSCACGVTAKLSEYRHPFKAEEK